MKVYRNGRELIIAKDPGSQKWGKFQPRRPQNVDPDDEDAYDDFKQTVVDEFEKGWNAFIEDKETPTLKELRPFYYQEFREDFNDYLSDNLVAEVENLRSSDFYGWLIDLEATM